MSAMFVALALLTAAVAAVLVVAFVITYRRYAGKRLVTCPENRQPAAVDVDALHAAAEAIRTGGAELRLNACSRWPAMAGCEQPCVSQIADSPEQSLVRTIVAQWYAGKRCAMCAREIPPIAWHEQAPAVLGPDGVTKEWTEERPEALPAIFKTHQPICFTCHLGESFRHEHPEWVVERQRPEAKVEVLKPTEAVY